MNSNICQPSNLSNTLENTGDMEICLSSSFVIGLAIFQSFGKYASVIEPLMILVRGPLSDSATNIMNVVGI